MTADEARTELLQAAAVLMQLGHPRDRMLAAIEALSPRVVHIHRAPEQRSICLRCGAPFEDAEPTAPQV